MKPTLKDRLISERDAIRKRYGSYLATEVFRKERERVGRINHILLYRYGYVSSAKTIDISK